MVFSTILLIDFGIVFQLLVEMSANKKKGKSTFKRIKVAATASLLSIVYIWCITIILVIFHLVCPYEQYLMLDDFIPAHVVKLLTKHKKGFWRFIIKSPAKNTTWGKFLEMIMVGTETFVYYWRELFVFIVIYFVIQYFSGKLPTFTEVSSYLELYDFFFFFFFGFTTYLTYTYICFSLN